MSGNPPFKNKEPKAPRPYIGVKFDCCGVYQRIYRNQEDDHYEGRCPKCLRALLVKVDPQTGKSVKFLRAE